MVIFPLTAIFLSYILFSQLWNDGDEKLAFSTTKLSHTKELFFEHSPAQAQRREICVFMRPCDNNLTRE